MKRPKRRALTREGRQILLWIYDDMYEEVQAACAEISKANPDKPRISMSEYIRGAIAKRLRS